MSLNDDAMLSQNNSIAKMFSCFFIFYKIFMMHMAVVPNIHWIAANIVIHVYSLAMDMGRIFSFQIAVTPFF